MIEIFEYDKVTKKIHSKKLSELDISNNLIWIDCVNLTIEEREQLQKTFSLHPLTAEDLYNSHVRIKVEEFDNYIFSVFYSLTDNHKLEMIEMDFLIGNNFLITSHKKGLNSFKNIKNDSDKLLKLFNQGIDFLFHQLLDKEVDEFFPILEKIEDELEKIEEIIIKNPNPESLQKILRKKREIINVKKHVLSQREKIGFLAKNEYKFISKKAKPYFRDIYDHAIRVSDMIENQREAVGNAFDAYMSSMSNKMNEVMKTLSIIATIALPLTVISGIYGTNFAVLPGSEINNGFWVMIGLMFIMTFGMLYYFKKMKWF